LSLLYWFDSNLMDLEEKYQCHICMEMASKPIVTPCGHLFW
jgi:hypothetical protein